jgi:hypothetical protein
MIDCLCPTDPVVTCCQMRIQYRPASRQTLHLDVAANCETQQHWIYQKNRLKPIKIVENYFGVNVFLCQVVFS